MIIGLHLRMTLFGQSASDPHILPTKTHGKDLQEAIINVSVQVVAAPFQAVSMEALAVIMPPQVALLSRLQELVGVEVETPMEGRAGSISTTVIRLWAVSSGFYNVDFSALGPRTVQFVLGHHPIYLISE